MSIRVLVLLLLVPLLNACDTKAERPVIDYTPEVFNAKWMAGALYEAPGKKTSSAVFLVGEQGSIIRSEDGLQWHYTKTPVTHRLRAISSDKRSGVLVAVGDKGTILRSDNGGHHWAKAALVLPKNVDFSDTELRALIHYPVTDVWLAAGTHNAIVRSTDQGRSWTLVSYNTFAEQKEILAFFVEQQSKNLLLAAQRGTIGRSSDSGLTWTIEQLDMQVPGDYIPHIVGFHQYGKRLIAAADLGRLLISENAGEDWQLLKLPTRGYFTDSAHDPQNNVIVMATQMGEIARSEDGGKSWLLQTLLIDNWPSEDTPYLSAVVFDDKSRSFFVVGNSGVIARSQDAGKSWHTDVLAPLFNLSVSTLLQDPSRERFVVAGAGGFLASTDSPLVSKNLQHGWEVIRPGIEQYMRQVVHIPGSDTFVVVGQLGGIWRSENDGRQWQFVAVDYPHQNQPPHLRDLVVEGKSGALIAAGPAGSIVRSSDGGRHWTPVFQGAIHKGEAFTQILTDKKRDTLLACEVLYQSVYRSADKGLSWRKIASIDSGGRRLWHGARSEKLDLILMVGQRGAVSVSRDGGQTWQMGETVTHSDLYGAFIEERSGALFAVGENGVILRSQDGHHWQAVMSATDNTLRHMFAESTGVALLAFGQGGTIVRSTDGGRQWARVKTPVDHSELRKVLIEPGSDNLVVIGSGGVILHSTDQGEKWQRLESHTLHSFRSADFNPRTGTMIAVGDGLLRLSRNRASEQ